MHWNRNCYKHHSKVNLLLKVQVRKQGNLLQLCTTNKYQMSILLSEYQNSNKQTNGIIVTKLCTWQASNGSFPEAFQKFSMVVSFVKMYAWCIFYWLLYVHKNITIVGLGIILRIDFPRIIYMYNYKTHLSTIHGEFSNPKIFHAT